MKDSAAHYEEKALAALSAAYTSSTNEDYNLRAAQVYATLAQAATTFGLAVVTERVEDVLVHGLSDGGR